VTGVGGVFFKARDPAALAEWYRAALGIDVMDPDGTGSPMQTEAGMTVISTFAADSDYFGRAGQQWMVNFRVDDLDAVLDQLRASGADVDDKVELMDGIGRFGWATDPEGNRFELWEPAPG
jgi:predicted enzyme related to lactoylglutathione lyase